MTGLAWTNVPSSFSVSGSREVLIPVRPGRPIWILIETAAMNERLKHMGYYSAVEFNRNVTRWLDSRSRGKSP